MYKLLIIDDEPLVQVGIRSMLHWDEIDVEICGVANNGQNGLEIIQKEKPDVVITDIKMPAMSGLELIKKCREIYGNNWPAFIVLTSYEEFQLAKEAISYQIVEYLVKVELTPAELKNAVTKAISMIKSHRSSTETNRENSSLSLNDMQSLRDKFFIRLLHNLYDSEEQFKLLQKDINIPFNSAFYQCCYFEAVNEKADSLPVEKQVTLYSNSFHLLQEIMEKYQHSYFVTLDRKHGVIILLYAQNEKLKSSGELKEMFQQISDTLYSYYSTCIHCGIGNPVALPLAISDSYMSARQAFSQTDDKTTIADIETYTCEPSKYAIFNIAIFKNDLSKAFSEYDADLLQEVMKQISSLFEEHPANYIQSLDAACNVLFLALSMLPDGDATMQELFMDIPDGYRSIYKQKTTQQVVHWMRLFTERTSRMFVEHKKEHRHHVVEDVKKYIAAHLQDRLNLNEISALYGISPNYLSSLFKKYNDCGYSEYITNLKIEEAKRIMSESNRKVYEIADALGFESAFYFSKVFKKVEGISPTEYINNL